jgi:hypothetical protein
MANGATSRTAPAGALRQKELSGDGDEVAQAANLYSPKPR